MKVTWERWPEPKGGTQDDPILESRQVEGFREAVETVQALQTTWGDALRVVHVEICLFRLIG